MPLNIEALENGILVCGIFAYDAYLENFLVHIITILEYYPYLKTHVHGTLNQDGLLLANKQLTVGTEIMVPAIFLELKQASG